MSTVYIRKIGTELGVIIPSNIVDEKKIKLGDWYGINLQEDGSIVLSPIEDVSISNVRPDVLEKAQGLMEKYKNPLSDLKRD